MQAKKIALCFQINLGKFKASERPQWTALMERIDKFFFSLLILRSVEGSSSSLVFNVPPSSRLQVCVEIPDRRGHLEELDAHGRPLIDEGNLTWLMDELPVLAAVAHFENASEAPFHIGVGSEAMHVSKYLKAYEDGSIDHLYAADGIGPKVYPHTTSTEFSFPLHA